MTVLDSVHRLPGDLLYEIQWTIVGILFNHIQDGQLAVVEHQVKPALPAEHLNQIDEIRVLELAQHADLAHGDLAYHRIRVILGVPLDGHHLAALPIDALVNNTLRKVGVRLAWPLTALVSARLRTHVRSDAYLSEPLVLGLALVCARTGQRSAGLHLEPPSAGLCLRGSRGRPRLAANQHGRAGSLAWRPAARSRSATNQASKRPRQVIWAKCLSRRGDPVSSSWRTRPNSIASRTTNSQGHNRPPTSIWI